MQILDAILKKKVEVGFFPGPIYVFLKLPILVECDICCHQINTVFSPLKVEFLLEIFLRWGGYY